MIFGQVLKGTDTVRLIEDEPIDETSRPTRACTIVDCGELAPGAPDGVVVDPLDPYPDFPLDCPQSLQVTDKLLVSNVIRERGNELFKAGHWTQALAKYSKAIRYLESEVCARNTAAA